MRRIIIAISLSALFSVSMGAKSLQQDSVPENKSVVEKIVSWYMDHMNYATITLLMTVESSFIPFPSEVIVPPAAYKASQKGSGLNIVLVVLFATLGALIGALINYYLALLLGRPVIYRFAESRLGKMCLLSREKIEESENYFVKHGNISTLIGRLIPAVRQLISIPAGLSKMRMSAFLLYTTVGALLWNIILAILGYIAHGNAGLIDRYNRELSFILLGLGFLFVLYLIYNGFFRKNKRNHKNFQEKFRDDL
jgi:membrane protein DedA with SNARE-associated domain